MNTNLKVNQLNVQSFRGISKVKSLDLKNITILYGVNGTGKSSFVNSLEYLFSGELSFLKKNTINKNKSSINKNSTKKSLKIELTFENGEYIRLLGSKKDYSDEFIEILKNPYIKSASFILNRSKLLQFIDGTQGKRYDAILDLLGIKNLNTIESNFSSTATKFRKEFYSSKEYKEEKIVELSNILNGDGSLDYHDCMVKLNNILEKNGEDIIIHGKTDLDDFIENLNLSKYTTIQNKINEFNEIYTCINLLDLSLDLNKIVNDYQLIASDNLKSSQYLISTLNSSKEYIEFTKTNVCPICENNINYNEVLLKLEDKISNLTKSNNLYEDWKTSVNSLILKIDSQIKYFDNLHEIVNDLNNMARENFTNFNFDTLLNLKKDLFEFLNFNKLPADFVGIDLNNINKELEFIKNQLVTYESNQNISDLSNLFYALLKIKEIDELQKDIKNLESQFKIAQKTFNIFTKTKEEFINNIIFEIREDIKYFYNYIHEDDVITNPDIVLSGSKKIDVYLDSFGDMVDSRSFASEGHLDTLGICIFLAFNKKFSDLPLIVLDDVLTTVDVYHKEKIAKLLIEELIDYQFIITAHNHIWINQLKEICSRYDREYAIYELIGWSLEEGPLISL